jgi:hypothetical protein
MKFLDSGDSRETSQEIINAIWSISKTDAERIWSEPDQDELLAIWEIVTGNGSRATTDYCWGASGTQWGDAL